MTMSAFSVVIEWTATAPVIGRSNTPHPHEPSSQFGVPPGPVTLVAGRLHVASRMETAGGMAPNVSVPGASRRG